MDCAHRRGVGRDIWWRPPPHFPSFLFRNPQAPHIPRRCCRRERTRDPMGSCAVAPVPLPRPVLKLEPGVSARGSHPEAAQPSCETAQKVIAWNVIRKRKSDPN